MIGNEDKAELVKLYLNARKLQRKLRSDNKVKDDTINTLTKALEFYADDSGEPEKIGECVIDRSGYWIGNCDDHSDAIQRIRDDQGRIARQALAQTKLSEAKHPERSEGADLPNPPQTNEDMPQKTECAEEN